MNPHCDNDKCVSARGEVRSLPTGHGNAILCRRCFCHEMDFRRERIKEGVPYDLPSWDSLKVYAEARPYQPKTGAPCSCRRGVERDNCPQCEGTGMVIDFAAIRSR